MPLEYIEITHTNQGVTTLDEFIEYHLLIDISAKELLNYKDNNASILNSYRPEDLAEYGNQANVELIRVPTKIKVPIQNVRKEIISTSNNIVFENNFFDCFIEEQIADIIDDPGFIPLSPEEFSGRNQLGEFRRIQNSVNVWIWCKGLGDDEEGIIFNLSPFIELLNTNIGANGGNFSINLPSINAIFEDNQWKIDPTSFSKYSYNRLSNFVFRGSDKDIEQNKFKRSKSFFSQIITSNDVVFISFEPLEMESDADLENEKLVIHPSKLKTRVWDMIGLVDNIRINSDFPTSQQIISVSGRDLMKLLIEDGCYVYPLDYATSSGEYFDNENNLIRGQKYSRPVERLITSDLNFFNAYLDRSIEFSVKFIFNLLSNIEICSDDLFSFYDQDDITFRYEFYTPKDKVNTEEIDDYPQDVQKKLRQSAQADEEKRKRELQQVPAPGIWKIIKLAIDPEISNRRIVDSSISVDQGSLVNFIRKIVQQPFAEFYGDTYGQKYFFIFRKPPFDLSGFNSNFVVDIDEADIYQENLSFDDQEVYSWYRLIPRGNFFGDADEISLHYLPAIFFEEYARIWGSRPLEVVSNYIDYSGTRDTGNEFRLDYLLRQARNDLAYIIETNAYKPFTRRGSILIRGDRRIKKGMNIRHKGTGEIFYVESVSNNFNVNGNITDRYTNIQVSRGMVEKYTYKNEPINYFKIIDLDKRNDTGESVTLNFKLNEDVFNFFLKRKQFQ